MFSLSFVGDCSIYEHDHVFLQFQAVGSITNLGNNEFLCASITNKCYYIVNLKTHVERKLVDGFSECQSVAFFPGFNAQTLPLLLTREQNNVCILNLKTAQILKIADGIPSGMSGCPQSNLISFIEDEKHTFITGRDNY